MSKKKKMLYVMNVNWSWIRQRPHILAQQLDELYDLTVLYPQYISKPWKRQYKTKKTKDCKPIFQIPFEKRFTLLSRIQEKIILQKLKNIKEYDILWLSSPVYAKYIPSDYEGMIIYDNMDDNVALQKNPEMARRMSVGQEILFENSDLIFVTSNNLLERLPKKVQEKSHLVRNGSCIELIEKIQQADATKEKYHIGYLGTISEWFNFKLVEECVKRNPNVIFDLYGPSAVAAPKSERIILHGVIEHAEIVSALKEMDCLIMPFILNDIVLAVDPVKLYEYIGLGKCIIAIKYPEVERFEDFVYFYEDEKSFNELLNSLILQGFPPKYDKKKQKEFLINNSWEQRIKDIEQIIAMYRKEDEK